MNHESPLPEPAAASQPQATDQLLANLREVMEQAVRNHSPVRFATSLSAEDMVLTDLIQRWELPIESFTLDTGRLPEATHRLLGILRQHYGQAPRIYLPDATEVETLVATHGTNGFYDSVPIRRACCKVRKVMPLRRALAGAGAWITGMRRDQSPTRSQLEVQSWDQDYGLIKLNPLLEWSREAVWDYLRQNHVPYNALHDQGYASIGCAPCTRALGPDEPERAGRWWWEHPASKECGLHS